MADEERPAIIDGVPDFSESSKSQEQATPKLDPDPHGIGSQAFAMHRNLPADPGFTSHVRSEPPLNPHTPIELDHQQTPTHIKNGRFIAHNFDNGTVNGSRIEVSPLDGPPYLTVSTAIPRFTTNPTRNPYEREEIDQREGHYIKIGGTELAVIFDPLEERDDVFTKTEANELKKGIDKLAHLTRDHDEADPEYTDQLKELLERVTRRDRLITLRIGRDPEYRSRVIVMPSYGGGEGAHVIRLSQRKDGKPRVGRESKSGEYISTPLPSDDPDYTNQLSRLKGFDQHLTLMFGEDGQVLIMDGNGGTKRPSTLGSMVTLI